MDVRRDYVDWTRGEQINLGLIMQSEEGNQLHSEEREINRGRMRRIRNKRLGVSCKRPMDQVVYDLVLRLVFRDQPIVNVWLLLSPHTHSFLV